MVPAGFITGLSAATLWTAHAQYTTQISTELGKFQRYILKLKFLFILNCVGFKVLVRLVKELYIVTETRFFA